MDSIVTIGVIFYLLFIMYGANQVEIGDWPIDTLRIFLYSLSVFVFLIAPFSLQALTISLNPSNAELRDMIDPLQAMIVAGFALFCATFGYNLIRSEETREWLAGRLVAYKPDSAVHLVAHRRIRRPPRRTRGACRQRRALAAFPAGRPWVHHRTRSADGCASHAVDLRRWHREH